jgi:hypothetical protein
MSIGKTTRCCSAALAIVGAGVCAAFGADGVLPLVNRSAFYEVYLDDPPSPATRAGTVGAVIVGMRLDTGPTKFSPDHLRILLGSAKLDRGTLCLKIISRDGKYFARGLYRLEDTNGVVITPEFPSKYANRISDYDVADVAVSAVRSPSCDDVKDADYVPVVYDTRMPAPKLVVQLRAGDARLRAQIGSERNETFGPAVLCSPLIDGPTIGFTTECALPLPDNLSGGAIKLSIGETGARGEIVVKTYPVRLRRLGGARP